ncbi:MAG: hypothetical protein ACOXZM_06155 [Eubacteriales bacterium]|jgi:hypothetical protein
MDKNTASEKINIFVTLSLVWLAWFIGNLCANALFYLGKDFKDLLPPDLQGIIYHWGTLVYFITVAIIGIIVPLFYIKKWQLDVCLWPEKISIRFVIASLLLMVALIGLGIVAICEEHQLGLSDIFSKDFAYLISPLILLAPTMVAYTVMWYGLFLQGFMKIFGNSILGKLAAIVLTSFIYAIYHFASINEIHSFAAFFEETLITFGISVVICIYVILDKSLFIAFIANLALNFLIFSPVETFHSSPENWLFSYLIVGILLLCYCLLSKHLPGAKSAKR